MFNRKKRHPTLKRVLSKELPCSRRRIFVADKHLDPITDQAMREFMVQDTTNELLYQEELQDCDNYALYFLANAKFWFAKKGINAMVGLIWTYLSKDEEAHAFIFSVKPNFKVTFWEPQTDRQRFLDARVKLVMI